MDYFSEFCRDKTAEFLTGTYYPRRPITTGDSGQEFSYSNLDPQSKEYKTLIGTLLVEGRATAIRTRAATGFKTKGYIVTQDGQLWQISSILDTVQNVENEDALRLFKNAAGSEKVVRMVGVENPAGLK